MAYQGAHVARSSALLQRADSWREQAQKARQVPLTHSVSERTAVDLEHSSASAAALMVLRLMMPRAPPLRYRGMHLSCCCLLACGRQSPTRRGKQVATMLDDTLSYTYEHQCQHWHDSIRCRMQHTHVRVQWGQLRAAESGWTAGTCTKHTGSSRKHRPGNNLSQMWDRPLVPTDATPASCKVRVLQPCQLPTPPLA
jgi:hypothetical protein